MIVCPNCNHQNPEGAIQCEACYTPLPVTTNCPNCGASIQTDATFCGQCGFNLQIEMNIPSESMSEPEANLPETPESQAKPPMQPIFVTTPDFNTMPFEEEEEETPIVVSQPPLPVAPTIPSATAPKAGVGATQLQVQTASLLHVQTNTEMELLPNLTVIHIGKPNDKIPPDIDVSGFPSSEIVSRIHADIRVEGDSYFLEDVGSSNGTYVNHTPLAPGNRHKLRAGDRIALGKGDKVTFIFQMA